jgi:hypothetical protein
MTEGVSPAVAVGTREVPNTAFGVAVWKAAIWALAVVADRESPTMAIADSQRVLLVVFMFYFFRGLCVALATAPVIENSSQIRYNVVYLGTSPILWVTS